MSDTERLITGNDYIDMLIGTQRLVADMPVPEAKVAHFKKLLSLYPPVDLYGSDKVFDIDAVQSFAVSKHRPQGYRDVLSNVQVIGSICLDGAFRYLTDDTVPVDSLAVRIGHPIFMDFDPQAELGYQPDVLQIPVTEINAFISH